MTSKESVLKAILQHMVDRGVAVNGSDEVELLARIEGYESAVAKQLHEENSRMFYAHRVDLADYDAHGVFKGRKSYDTPAFFVGADNDVYQRALRESLDTRLPVAILDGNGQMTNLFDRPDVDLAVYVTLGALKNPEAEKVADLADDLEQISGAVRKWNHAAQDIAKARHLLLRRRMPDNAGQTQVVVAVQHTGKVVWRQTV